MMQIVLNTLQTHSGDQPDSGCVSQTQKRKGDSPSWAGTPAPSCGLCAGPAGGPRWGWDVSGLLGGWQRRWGPPVLSTLHAPIPHAASCWLWLPLVSTSPAAWRCLVSLCCHPSILTPASPGGQCALSLGPPPMLPEMDL